MNNGEKLKDLFKKFFPGVVLDEATVESCKLFKCQVNALTEEEVLAQPNRRPCDDCAYDNFWNKPYQEPTVEYFEGDAEATKDYMEMLESMGLFELKQINQKTKELINAGLKCKIFGRVEGSDQFIQKENEGGF